MAKTLRVRTRAGWDTKPVADTPSNKLTAGEADDNFLELWDSVNHIPSRLYKAELADVSASNPNPIDVVDDIAYGFLSNVLYSSTDNGTIWSAIHTFDGAAGELKRLVKTADGQYLALFNKKLFKSTTFPTTWTEKLDALTAQFIEWSLDGNGTKFIAADYAVPHTASQSLWISLNAGDTWTQYSKGTLHPGDDAATHFHGVAYDYIADRFWHVMGDGTYRGHYYSDNDGATWNEVPLGRGMLSTSSGAQAVTISTTPYGMVLGSDSGQNGGMYRILRHADPTLMRVEMMWRWPNQQTTIRGFTFKHVYDSKRNLTYMCWRTDVADNKPFVTWTNGLVGGILYEFEEAHTATDGIRNIIVFPDGKISGWVGLSAATNRTITIRQLHVLGESLSQADTGLLLGGTAGSGSGTSQSISLAVGQGATATESAMAVGPGATATSFGATALGVLANAPANSMAIGYNANVSGTNGLAIGRDTNAGANQQILIGVSVTSTFDRTVAIGVGAVDGGIQNVLVGYNSEITTGQWSVVLGAFAEATGNSSAVVGRIAKAHGTRAAVLGAFAQAVTLGTAIGYAANVTHVDSVAIGDSTATGIDNSVAIGARDLHVQNATKGVVLTSPDSTRYRITVDNAGTLSTAVV